jgi:hypothetical protein
LRAAYGPLVGRWAPARVIGNWHDDAPPANRYPKLAVAPDGAVLLAFDDNDPALDGPAVAWRAPGHPFGAPQALLRSANTRLEVPHQLGPIPAFDARGSAYVWGNCDGVVLSTSPPSHRFGSPVAVAPAPVLGFTVSLAGPGQGLAGWVHGVCTTDEAAGDTPGPVLARILRGGTFGPLLALSSADTSAGGVDVVALPDGSGSVGWGLTQGQIGAGGLFRLFQTTYTAPIADGVVGPVQQVLGGLTPVAATGGGDQVLAGSHPAGTQEVQGALVQGALTGGVVMRPAGGGADQPAPSPYGMLATATPLGRAAALEWNTSPTGGGPILALAVWRP